MRRVINHIRRWNKWRKYNLNGRLHKFLVLIGITKSPTMPYVWLDSEYKEFEKGLRKGFEEGLNEKLRSFNADFISFDEFVLQESEDKE